jgi:hypothetical protein
VVCFSVYFKKTEELYFLVKTYFSLHQCRNVGATLAVALLT